MSSVAVPGKGIQFTPVFLFNEMPPSGWLPMRIDIENSTDRGQSWNIEFIQSAMFETSVTSLYRCSVAVGEGASRSFNIWVPISGLRTKNTSNRQINMKVTGYAMPEGDIHVPVGHSQHNGTAYVGMSASLGTSKWAALPPALKSSTTAARDPVLHPLRSPHPVGAITGTVVDATDLPPDIRSFAGLAAYWLRDTELSALSAPHRAALARWVIEGGHLHIAAEKSAPASVSGLPALEGLDRTSRSGFGSVTVEPLELGELSVGPAAARILSLDSKPSPAWSADYEKGWRAKESLGWPAMNVPLLIGFVFLFAIVIGPVNLLLLAPSLRRHRLFITVPLLSAGASILLFVIILTGDGVGGAGHRSVLAYIAAGSTSITAMQEQAVRTRLLFARNFSLPEDARISMIMPERYKQKISVERSAKVLSMDWFRSRTLQAHHIVATTPSRAEVVLVSGPGQPPVLLSSVPGTLHYVHYYAEDGACWTVKAVNTGQPAKLEPISVEAYHEWLHSHDYDLSSNFQALWKEAGYRPGHFYARSGGLPGAPVATLPSITWEMETVLCFGPCGPLKP